MSPDVLRKLSYAVGVLVVLWIGSEFVRGTPSDGVTVLEAPDITVDDVDSISIDRPAEDVHLVRRDSAAWTVNGWDAAYGGVSDLVGALEDDLRLQLVARNADTHSRFDLGEDRASRMRVYRGGTAVLDLLIGKRGRDYQSVFLRHPGEDEVYSARTRLANFTERRVEDWRDKVVTAIEPDSIRQVVVTRGTEHFTLLKDDQDVWSVDGAPAKGADVGRLIDQFRALNAAGFPTEAQADSVDFDPPDRRVQLTDGSDRVLADLAFDSTSTGFWVKTTAKETVYRLDRFKVDQLTPADSTLREVEPGG